MKPTPEMVSAAERMAQQHALTLGLAAIGGQKGDMALAKRLLAEAIAKAMAKHFAAGRHALSQDRGGERG